jgi:hypothetical protein
VNASAYPVRASAPDPVLTRYQAWLATPAGQAVASRYRLTRPDPAAATPGPPRAGRTWRLHLPVREIVATAVAAAGAFVAVLLAVLWLSSRRARSGAAPGRAGPGPGRWEARTWSFGPGQADEHRWPPDLPGRRHYGLIGAGGSSESASKNGMTAAASAGEPKMS